MITASQNAPKAAAQEAFSNINAITPAFTALQIFLPTGSLKALYKGVKIIPENGSKKINASKLFL